MTVNNNLISRYDAMMATDVDIENWTSRNNAEAWWACGEVLKEIRTNITNLPECDVKHGRWEKVYLDHMSAGRRPALSCCSECCECSIFETDYCPHCGARMDKN